MFQRTCRNTRTKNESSILKSKAMTISELKQSGYYIQISIDHAKKQTQYQLVKDISGRIVAGILALPSCVALFIFLW